MFLLAGLLDRRRQLAGYNLGHFAFCKFSPRMFIFQ